MRRLALAALLVGCPSTDPPETDAAPVDAHEWTVEAASWTLTWSDGQAADDSPWTTVTDTGYEVTVAAGWVVDYAVTLSPCEEEVVATREERLLSLLGVGTARADHPDFDDPSQVEMVAASALGAGSVEVAAAFDAAAYCGLHLLIARGDEDTAAPDGTSASGISLKLRGSWAKDGETGTFDLETNWANARDWTWGDVSTAVAGDAPPGAPAADITVRRDRDRLFDGLDLADASEGGIAWGVLENLFEQATVEVTFSAS